jgi:hypothetical protein
MRPHTPHITALQSSPARAKVMSGALMLILLMLPSLASAQDKPSPLTNLPALTTFALTSDSSAQLHVVLDQRPLLAHHKDLHVMCNDARQRQNKRHWVFPTIRSISRVITHNGVVLVRPKPEQPLDATARIIPTLSLNTVGAKLRISF